MFAVIKTGGRQYRVVPDDVLEVGKIEGEVGTIVQLNDRTDLAVDLADLKHVIRNDTVLPAAGLDDCEHRCFPSCSIPASGKTRVGFLFSRYGSVFRGRT